MRTILLSLFALILTGCGYIFQKTPVSPQQRHQICHRIEHKLNYGDDDLQSRNAQDSVLTHARLLREYRRYNCAEALNQSNQQTSNYD